DAWAAGREYDKVFDGDTATFFDCMDPTGGYAGMQVAQAAVVTRIRFYPRLPQFPFRMNGGKFQGSTDGSSYTDLHVINENPAAAWNEVMITGAAAYTYLRYIGPVDSYCNVAEIEFFGVIDTEPTNTPPPGEEGLLSGTVFGHGDAWAAGSEYDKAFDGDTATYFDCADPSGGYTGIQLGSSAAVTKIRFHPRLPNFPHRMKNGKIQGSADGLSYTDLYIVSSIPAAGWNEVTIDNANKYTYLRYVGADGTYCNVAEIEFYGSGGTGLTPTDTPIATSTPTPTGTIIATITPSPTPTSTPTPTATPTPTNPPAVVNLAPNPSFEQDPSEHYWHSGTANFSWATDASHHGSRSLKIVSTTSARTFWMSRQIKGMIPFTPGKEYTLKGWVKHTSGTAQLVIQGFNGSTWKGSALSSTSTGSTGWRELSVSYTPPSVVNILRLDFWYYGPGSHWVDDITLYDANAQPPENTPTPAPTSPSTGIPTDTPTVPTPSTYEPTSTPIPPTNTPVEGDNLAANPGFEYGQEHWSGWGTGKIVADDENYHTGLKYCKIIINDTWRSVYQNVPVIAGKSYQVKMWIRTVNVTSLSRIHIIWYNESSVELAKANIAGPSGTSGSYKLVGSTLTAPANAKILRIHCSTTPGSGEAYFDDVEVVGEGVVEPTDTPSGPTSTPTPTFTEGPTSTPTQQGTGVAWPLKVSSSKRYLVDQNGKPFFVLSDTGWRLPYSYNPSE
ncbi:carbohydrate binding domain-containing protein, partial [Spirochaetota bacterium]